MPIQVPSKTLFKRSFARSPRVPDVRELLEEILSAQLSPHPGGLSFSGERALRIAVLRDAVQCVIEGQRNPQGPRGRLCREAEKWIQAKDWDWPFSFNNVCESLDLDPERVRQVLLGNSQRPKNHAKAHIRDGVSPKKGNHQRRRSA